MAKETVVQVEALENAEKTATVEVARTLEVVVAAMSALRTKSV